MLKDAAKFTAKHLCQILLFNKVAGCRSLYIVQIQRKIFTTFFNKSKNSTFGQFSPNSGAENLFFKKNPALIHTDSYGFLKQRQKLEKVKDLILRKRKDGRTDGSIDRPACLIGPFELPQVFFFEICEISKNNFSYFWLACNKG